MDRCADLVSSNGGGDAASEPEARLFRVINFPECPFSSMSREGRPLEPDFGDFVDSPLRRRDPSRRGLQGDAWASRGWGMVKEAAGGRLSRADDAEPAVHWAAPEDLGEAAAFDVVGSPLCCPLAPRAVTMDEGIEDDEEEESNEEF